MSVCPYCRTENEDSRETCRSCNALLLTVENSGNDPTATVGRTQDPLLGKALDEYRILGVLGRGGMGVVYEAEDVNLGRRVALKMMSSELSANPEIRERFEKEARIQARLAHPEIATVFAFKEAGPQAFLVMERVQGETLRDRMKARGRFSPQEAVTIAVRVLGAMAYAHRMGVVHRDLKPANIVLTPEGEVKIMDFGIAKIAESEDGRLTRTGTLVGTLAYMAPEQVKGLEVDPRTDVYSLGVTFYEMLTGAPPFKSDSEYEIMAAHVEKAPPSIRSTRAEVSPALEHALLKALEKDPANRYQSADEFARALEGSLNSPGPERTAPTSPHPPDFAPQQHAPEKPRHSRAYAWIASILLVSGVAGGAWWWVMRPLKRAAPSASHSADSAPGSAPADSITGPSPGPAPVEAPGVAVSLPATDKPAPGSLAPDRGEDGREQQRTAEPLSERTEEEMRSSSATLAGQERGEPKSQGMASAPARSEEMRSDETQASQSQASQSSTSGSAASPVVATPGAGATQQEDVIPRRTEKQPVPEAPSQQPPARSSPEKAANADSRKANREGRLAEPRPGKANAPTRRTGPPISSASESAQTARAPTRAAEPAPRQSFDSKEDIRPVQAQESRSEDQATHASPALAPPVEMARIVSRPKPADVRRELVESLRAKGFQQVEVSVDDQLKAILTGTVVDDQERRRVIEAARSNKDVRELQDNLVNQRGVWKNFGGGKFVDDNKN